MTQYTEDLITIASAIGGVVGIIYATVQIVKTKSRYVNSSDCIDAKKEYKLEIEKESKKREYDISILHEKVNAISDRVSKIEGRLYEKSSK